MLLEEGLYSYLVSAPGVAALVGTRVYPLVLPQASPVPAIIYSRVGGPRVKALAAPPGVQRARVQLSVFATSYAEVKAVAEALRLALDGHRGSWGAGQVQAVSLVSENDLFGGDSLMYHVAQDYEVWADEPVT